MFHFDACYTGHGHGHLSWRFTVYDLPAGVCVSLVFAILRSNF